MTTGVGSRVLTTGASGGFGAPTVRRLRERGATVIGLDQVAGDGVLACDVTDDRAVDRAVTEAAERLGGLDAVVHYAGIGTPNDAGGPLHPDAFRVIDVNLLGAWRVTAAALPHLVDGPAKGRVEYGTGMYGAGLHVTTVYPGYVRTPIHDAGREVGLALEGQVRSETVEDIVGTVLGVLTAARPPRDTAGTWLGGLELWAGRHLPGLVSSIVTSRLHRQVAAGVLDTSLIAAGLVRRLTGRDITLPTPGSTRTPTERSTS